MSFAVVRGDFICLDLSDFGGSDLPCDLVCYIDLRRIVGFSVCSAFYLLLGWSEKFQTPEAEPGSPMLSQLFFEVVFFFLAISLQCKKWWDFRDRVPSALH